MKTALIVLLITLNIGYIFAQNCTVNTDCDTCAAMIGCGWCAPTQQCIAGTAAGPNVGMCVGDAWEFGKCTPCGQFTDCRTCNSRSTDCFWCAKGSGTCYPIGFVGCPWEKECPCGIYDSCTECANDIGCQWCGLSQTCASINGNCSIAQPTFNYTTGCPCNGNLDCSNCLQTTGCSWCKTGGCATTCGSLANTTNNCQVYCSNVANTCGECIAMPGCSWCPDSKSCVDSSSSSCQYTNECAVCSAASYCDTCQSMGPECVWCEDSKSCEPVNTNCMIAHTCNNYCETNDNCIDCNTARGCGWCDDSSTCVDIATTNCFYSHTCFVPPIDIVTNKVSKFSGKSFVGGMFFVIGLFVLAFAAYYFYRWRTGRKFDYREMK